MRDTTERPEALEAGTVKLVGTNKNLIISKVSRLLDDDLYYRSWQMLQIPMEMKSMFEDNRIYIKYLIISQKLLFSSEKGLYFKCSKYKAHESDIYLYRYL
jgi:hypothetical protein